MHEDYAFALPLNSGLRKNINESLLRYIDTEEWPTMLREYLGQERSELFLHRWRQRTGEERRAALLSRACP
jgi:hypothetical protein